MKCRKVQVTFKSLAINSKRYAKLMKILTLNFDSERFKFRIFFGCEVSFVENITATVVRI